MMSTGDPNIRFITHGESPPREPKPNRRRVGAKEAVGVERRARLLAAGASQEVADMWAITWPPNVPPPSMSTAVYRHFTVDDRLLYVGKAMKVGARQGDHLKLAPWIIFSARFEVKWFASEEAAAIAEIVAIGAEKPLFNYWFNNDAEARNRLVAFLTEQDRMDLFPVGRTRKYRAEVAVAGPVSPVPEVDDSLDAQLKAVMAISHVNTQIGPFTLTLEAWEAPELMEWVNIMSEPAFWLEAMRRQGFKVVSPAEAADTPAVTEAEQGPG